MESINPLTEPVKVLKSYFTSFGSGGISEDTLESGVMKVLQGRCSNEDKAFLHMVLFFHVDLDSGTTNLLDYVQDNPDDFLGLLPSMSYRKGFSLDLYCRFVLDGNLTQHFFQMLLALPEKYTCEVQGAVTRLVDMMATDPEKYYDVYFYVLLMLVKLSRSKDNNIMNAYHLPFVKLAKKYFMEFQGIKREEKLANIFRLVGVACMMDEDYQTSSNDLAELLGEYDFDMSHRMAIDTKMYFEKLFSTDGHTSSSDQIANECIRKINPITIELLSDTLNELKYSEDEAKSFKAKKKTSKISWLDYIGVVAYLSKCILEKRLLPAAAVKNDKQEDMSIRDGDEKVQTLLNHIKLWSKYKLKLTIEDYEDDLADFDQFFMAVRNFGHKENLRQFLLSRFLKFSYDEIYINKEGRKITERYLIPGATYDIALEYMKKAMDEEFMPTDLCGNVPEKVKVAVLRIMMNETVRDKRGDIVREIFASGSHTMFTQSSFVMDITQVCSKLGSIENETNPKLIERNRDMIFNVCFQNPSSALESLLTQSIKSRKFKALEIARPFFLIPSSSGNTLIEDCFKNILDAMDEADPIFQLFQAAIPIILEQEILKANQLLRLLQSTISELMFKSSITGLGKSDKCFLLLESITKYLKSVPCTSKEKGVENQDQSPLEILQEIGAYAVEIAAVTCGSMSSLNMKSMIAIRRTCYSVMKLTKTDGAGDEDFSFIDRDESDYLYFLGFLYIRFPKFRPQVVSLIDQIDAKSVSEETGIDYVTAWVISSVPEYEWDSCVELLTLVICPKFSSEWGVTHPLKLINHCTYVVFETSALGEDHAFIHLWLKFYKQFVLKIWRKKSEMNKESQISILRTLVTLSIIIRKVCEEKGKSRSVQANLENTMQQLMLLVLDLVNLIIVSNSDKLDPKLKEKMLDIVTLLPTDVKYSNIFKCITERILKEKKSKMLRLPEDKLVDEEPNFELNVNDEISNASQ